MNDSILAQQLRMAMKSPLPTFFGAALALLAAITLQGQLPAVALDGWAAVMLVWQGARYILFLRFHRLETDAEIARQGLLVTAAWSVTGLLWGLFAAAYFWPADPEASFFMLLVVTSTIASGAVVVSPYLPAQTGYLLGAGVPAVTAFILHGTRFSLMTAAMGVGFAVAARAATLFGNRGVVDLLKLQQANSELLAETRKAKEAADLANHVKSRFLANMSHEFRTPLNAIIGFSELMRDEAFGPIGNPRYAGYVGDIHLSGRHLLGIVNDVLDLSKLEAGGMRLANDEIDLVSLADECMTIVGTQAKSCGVQLLLREPDVPVSIRADALRLKQILLNLMSNAVKFSPAGGQVTVAGKLAGNGDLVVSVSDNGIGMDQAGIATALQPFGQVENSFTRRHTGTGLGLPLAKWLVELHGGRLEIESKLGQGATIRIMLPASRVKRLDFATPALVAAR
jgi:signal transduction histidine kinase